MAASSTRAFPRYAIDATIELRTASQSAAGRTRNISRGGLCVDVDHTLQAGAPVEISIKLRFDDAGESEPLRLRARVAWSTAVDAGFQIGCQFEGLNAHDNSYLEMFLRYLEDKDGDAGDGEPAEDDPFA